MASLFRDVLPAADNPSIKPEKNIRLDKPPTLTEDLTSLQKRFHPTLQLGGGSAVAELTGRNMRLVRSNKTGAIELEKRAQGSAARRREIDAFMNGEKVSNGSWSFKKHQRWTIEALKMV
jgi:hypothetical protein